MSIKKRIDGKDINLANKSIISHDQLENRDAYGAHPISAIRKLPEKLIAIKNKNIAQDEAIENIETNAGTIETNARQIDVIENGDGTLTFYDYDNNEKIIRSGYMVDDNTIMLNATNKITIKKIYTNGTMSGLGTELDPLKVMYSADGTTVINNLDGTFTTIAMEDEISKITPLDIRTRTEAVDINLSDKDSEIADIKTVNTDQDNKISDIQSRVKGLGGYLNANNFNTATPSAASLTNYALAQIGISDPTLIFNQTKVKNLFDGNIWILTNTPDSDPVVFDWSNVGIEAIAFANNDGIAGIVKGSYEELEILIDANGNMTVNGLEESLNNKLDKETLTEQTVNSKVIIDNDLESKTMKLEIQEAEPTFNKNKFYINKQNQLTQMVNTEVKLNLGYEIQGLAYNNTGSILANGMVVSPTGEIEVDENGFSYPKVELADCRYKERCFPISITTEIIADESIGNVTKLGRVNNIDTSAWIGIDNKIVYLGNNGTITPVRPVDGNFIVILGHVINRSATVGSIEVEISFNELTSDVNNVNGFPETEKVKTSILVDEATRKITLHPLQAYHFYQYGEKYELDIDKEIIISDVEGRHAIFFNNGELEELVNPTMDQFKYIVYNYVWVAASYWNATDKKFEFVNDERHGLMKGEEHFNLHMSTQTVFLNGMKPSILSIDDVSPDNDSISFSVTSGSNLDEDITHTIIEKLNTDNIKEWYLSGTNNLLRTNSENNYGLSTTGSGLLAYNYFDGTSRSIAEVDSGDYVFRHIYAIPFYYKDATNYVSVMGQNQYVDKNSAAAGVNVERATLKAYLPTAELTHVCSILYHTKVNYNGNAYKAKIVTTDEDYDFYDFRTATVGASGGISASSHASLSDRGLANQHPASAITSGISLTGVIAVADWTTSTSATVNIPGISTTEDYDVIPSTKSDEAIRTAYGVYADPEITVADTLTFYCITKPTEDINITVKRRI